MTVAELIARLETVDPSLTVTIAADFQDDDGVMLVAENPVDDQNVYLDFDTPENVAATLAAGGNGDAL